MSDSFGVYWSNMADYGTPNGDLQRGKPERQNPWPVYNRSVDLNIFMEHPTRVATDLNKVRFAPS